MSSNSFAITYTVKNEATVLPLAIAYHVAAGCSLVYLFWDGTTDDAEKLIEGLPVVARPSVRPEEMVDPPEWVTRLLPWWKTNMDVRKQIIPTTQPNGRRRRGLNGWPALTWTS